MSYSLNSNSLEKGIGQDDLVIGSRGRIAFVGCFNISFQQKSNRWQFFEQFCNGVKSLILRGGLGAEGGTDKAMEVVGKRGDTVEGDGREVFLSRPPMIARKN